jgi:DNA repair protein RadD
MILRAYQQAAVDAAWSFMRGSVSPFCIEAATGAGKSLMIAELARLIHASTGKKVLCLAPSAELVVQNREKYIATGNPASMFSASAGGKELRHPVVFGSPLTVKNKISRFGAEYGLVICDECHGLTPTLISIIDAMREANPNLRVCGMTATPYRLGSGYIFRMHPDGKINGDDVARDPYFVKCVYKVQARELIDLGFLTPPIIGGVGATGYDTSGLVANAMGKFDAVAVDQAYHGHGRKTSAIVADVVAQSRDRQGVMFFAATVRHANEVLASLPPELSAIVTGETPKPERDKILKAFKARRIKYLVNVSVLTTGFDAPHVDVIALLRKTESVGLLQQIIGRGLRIDDGKTDCLVLDYTTNLADHCPDGDLFAPVVRANKSGESGGGMTCECPECGTENLFSGKLDLLEYAKDAAGYCLDLYGVQVMTEFGPLSGHWGRRCMGLVQTGARGEFDRCQYRWTSKDCPHCEAANDIAARYCIECKGEIVDPNEKLLMDFKALKKDPTKLQTDEVLGMECKPGVSRAGNPTMRVEFRTPYRQFVVWFQTEAAHIKGQAQWKAFCDATNESDDKPSTITYRKNADTGFFEVIAYNRPADTAPDQEVKHAAE